MDWVGGLGGPSTGSGSGAGANSMFGSFAMTPAISQTPSTSSGSGSGDSMSSFVKPATGFGVFTNQTTSSPFAPAAANANKPAGGFGAFAGLS